MEKYSAKTIPDEGRAYGSLKKAVFNILYLLICWRFHNTSRVFWLCFLPLLPVAPPRSPPGSLIFLWMSSLYISILRAVSLSPAAQPAFLEPHCPSSLSQHLSVAPQVRLGSFESSPPDRNVVLYVCVCGGEGLCKQLQLLGVHD